MRALHVIAGLDLRHGGPSYSVPRLCAALRGLGAETRILTVREEETREDPFTAAHGHDFAHIPLLRELRLSSRLEREARSAARAADVVHAHGLWLMPNVSAGRAAADAGRPLIVSPRGMLAPEALAFSARRKRLFWRLLQRRAYAHAAVWHATSSAEAEDIRAFGIRAPIAIIPNGVDVSPRDAPLRQREGGSRLILHLGRIHPKKGLPNLIAAWGHLAGERPEWTLRIIGPDEGGHRRELEEMTVRISARRVVFGDPVYGPEKARVLREADLFVLPTRNENFGLAVAEALAAGIPAIVSHGGPWSGLISERCGWWVERGVEPLLGALRAATELPDSERCAMGERGRAWMVRDFSWDRIAHDMKFIYDWSLGRAERPSTVHLD